MGGIGILQSELTVWDDLTFPTQVINPTGAVAASTMDQNSGVLLFSGTADNSISVIAQITHQ